MNESIRKVLTENNWSIATYGEGVNVVPVGIKAVMNDSTLIIADNFLGKTKANILSTGLIAISAYSPATGEGYQIKGKAEHFSEGELFQQWHDTFVAKYQMAPKGIVKVTVEKVYYTTPGANAGKEV